MGLYMDWENRKTSKRKMMVCGLHIFTVLLGAFVTVAGSYSSIQSIVNAYKEGTVGSAFSC